MINYHPLFDEIRCDIAKRRALQLDEYILEGNGVSLTRDQIMFVGYSPAEESIEGMKDIVDSVVTTDRFRGMGFGPGRDLEFIKESARKAAEVYRLFKGDRNG